MDPTENLKEQLRIIERLSSGDHDESDVDRLCELQLALHEWLANGGFPPAQWRPAEERKLATTIRTAAPRKTGEVMKTTWVEMSNGRRLDVIAFVVWLRAGDGRELRFDFEAPNPPIHEGNANLFSRLSFESIQQRFKVWGYAVNHIIRGECSESGVRDCYVYNRESRVPFAVIRPAVFADTRTRL